LVEEGLEPGVFSVVEGDVELAHALVAHPDIKAVGFTGSQAAGRSLLSKSYDPSPF
jgi:acyl-CoA reductase-like NAD-dependent aldehyde dehydrogenase